MGRRRTNRARSVQQRVNSFRQRAKKRKEQNERVRAILQEQYQEDLNTSDVLEENVMDNELKLKIELRNWANDYHISKRAINHLLSILHSNGIRQLPKNYRTLQGTPKTIETVNVAGGKLWYNGVGKCLEAMFSTLSQNLTISLNFNIDGLPLFKSSTVQFWPLLASIVGMLSYGCFFDKMLSKKSNEEINVYRIATC